MPDIIDKIIQREGPETNDPDDSGKRTKFGISEVYEPEAWADGDVTRDEARAIYQRKYIDSPGFGQLSGLLQEFMVDWGVTSGPVVAIRKLQEALGTTVDGIIGPETLAAWQRSNPEKLLTKLIDMRIISYVKIAVARPKDLKFLLGWVNRALEFRRLLWTSRELFRDYWRNRPCSPNRQRHPRSRQDPTFPSTKECPCRRTRSARWEERRIA